MSKAVVLIAFTCLSALGVKKEFSLPSLSVAFRDKNHFFSNLDTLFSELQLIPERERPNECPRLRDYNLEKLSLKESAYAYRALTLLDCKADLSIMKKAAEKGLKSNVFADFMYSAVIKLGMNSESTEVCKRLEDFYDSKGKFRMRFPTGPSSFYLTANILDILQTCDKIGSFSLTLKKVLKEAQEGLEQVTKGTLAWLHESQTYLSTLKILNRSLEAGVKMEKSRLAKLIAFVERHSPFTLDLNEQIEFNRFLTNSKIFEDVKAPDVLNLDDCREKCKLSFTPAKKRTVIAHFGDRSSALETNDEGELLVSKASLEKLSEIAFDLEEKDASSFISRRKTFIIQGNQFTKVRMILNNIEQPLDIIDSDESDCSSISLKAFQSNFLHVGFKLKFEQPFTFVQLRSSSGFEDSSLVLARFDDQSQLFVASFDFGDYEVIRPNSDSYSIIVYASGTPPEVNSPKAILSCGSVEVVFKNKKRSDMTKPSDPLAIKLLNYENIPLPQPSSFFLALYFTLIVSLSAIVYVSALKKYFAKLQRIPSLSQTILASVALAIAVLIVFFTHQLSLIDNLWVIIALIFLFSFVAKKAFYD